MSVQKVSLIEVIAAVEQRRATLAVESAGYLILAIGAAAGSSRYLRPEEIMVSTDGEVTRGAPPMGLDTGIEVSAPALLRALLRIARGSGTSSLHQVANGRFEDSQTGEHCLGSFEQFLKAVEKALIPLNRDAAGRAIGRLARDTGRARARATLQPFNPKSPVSQKTWAGLTKAGGDHSVHSLPSALAPSPKSSVGYGLQSFGELSLPKHGDRFSEIEASSRSLHASPTATSRPDLGRANVESVASIELATPTPAPVDVTPSNGRDRVVSVDVAQLDDVDLDLDSQAPPLAAPPARPLVVAPPIAAKMVEMPVHHDALLDAPAPVQAKPAPSAAPSKPEPDYAAKYESNVDDLLDRLDTADDHAMGTMARHLRTLAQLTDCTVTPPPAVTMSTTIVPLSDPTPIAGTVAMNDDSAPRLASSQNDDITEASESDPGAPFETDLAAGPESGKAPHKYFATWTPGPVAVTSDRLDDAPISQLSGTPTDVDAIAGDDDDPISVPVDFLSTKPGRASSDSAVSDADAHDSCDRISFPLDLAAARPALDQAIDVTAPLVSPPTSTKKRGSIFQEALPENLFATNLDADEFGLDDSTTIPPTFLPMRRANGPSLAVFIVGLLAIGGTLGWQYRHRIWPAAVTQAAITTPDVPSATVTVRQLPKRHELLLELGGTDESQTFDAQLPQGVRVELIATAPGFQPERLIIPADAAWNNGKLRVAAELKAGPIDAWPAAPPGAVGGSGAAGTVTFHSPAPHARIYLVVDAGSREDATVKLLANKEAHLVVVDLTGPPSLRRLTADIAFLREAVRQGGGDLNVQTSQ